MSNKMEKFGGQPPAPAEDESAIENKERRAIIEPFLPEDEKNVAELASYIIHSDHVDPEVWEYTGAYDDLKEGKYVVLVEENGTIDIETGSTVVACFFGPDQLEQAMPKNEFVLRICERSRKENKLFVERPAGKLTE